MVPLKYINFQIVYSFLHNYPPPPLFVQSLPFTVNLPFLHCSTGAPSLIWGVILDVAANSLSSLHNSLSSLSPVYKFPPNPSKFGI